MSGTSVAAPSSRWVSPLRYPGGKGRMADALSEIFLAQFGLLDIEVWAEPFAGGAGAGLHLLDRGVVSEVWLTERNLALAAFWRTVTANSDELSARVRTCQPDMAAWHAARELLAAAQDPQTVTDLDLAFAALIINRCSRSGMVNPRVGPIGGKNQNGRWNLQSRWNSEVLADRIDAIGQLGNRIRVFEADAIDHIAELDGSVGIEDELLLFVDPPYLVQGNRLYAHGMTFDDHKALAEALTHCTAHWLLTYDADDRIPGLYPDHRVLAYQIAHTANQARIDEEFAVLSDNLVVRDNQSLLPTGASRWVQHGPDQQPD
ncbi:DNA adenine methylase [Mycolicibacterium fortuitum]|uniref:DNA adenine methylase n=1 Tax=Mycolicibacterium fortuitum TaxID=1766 RepID=UPI0026355C2F|nr:DNA adenine methylase [Mycolicibacterium fortuitum]